MNERVVRFGPGEGLVGILTEPGTGSAADLPAVLLLNAGAVHRAGPCRLYVTISRRLADAGFAALRFDFSGVGDSMPRPDTLSFEHSSRSEIRAAIDHLARHRSLRRFVLLGLCAGADAAFFGALEDERIVGTVQLDPFAYRTPLFYWHHYAPRVGSLAVWRRSLGNLRARIRFLLGVPDAAAEPDSPVSIYVRKFPPRGDVAAGLAHLSARGVRQLCLFTGGVQQYYNYAAQYRHCFRDVDFAGNLDEHCLFESDHIITRLDHQQQVVDVIVEWMARFGTLDRSAQPRRASSLAGLGGSVMHTSPKAR